MPYTLPTQSKLFIETVSLCSSSGIIEVGLIEFGGDLSQIINQLANLIQI